MAIAGIVGGAAGGVGAAGGLAIGSAGRLAAASPAVRGAVIGTADNVIAGMASRGLTGGDLLDPRAMAGDLLLGGGAGAAGGALGSRHFRPERQLLDDAGSDPQTMRQTTILGENMTERVMPFAEATESRTLGFGATGDEWAAMTPQQRYRLNDGMLRARIREGDNFRYIGPDPLRPPDVRARFDLTRSELLRLDERGVPYDVVSPDEVFKMIDRY